MWVVVHTGPMRVRCWPRLSTLEIADPIAYVLSTNLHRRHLTDGQRAMLALEVEKMYAAQTKIGRPAKSDRSETEENSPPFSKNERSSAHRAAQVTKTSDNSVKKAKKLAKEAPDLAEKVKTGEMPLDRAARIQRDREAERRRVEQARQAAAAQPEPPRIDLRLGDFRDVLADLSDVDAIITDPP